MNDKLCVYYVKDTALHLTDYLFCFKDEYKLKEFKVFKTAYYNEDGIYNGCFVIGLNVINYINVFSDSTRNFEYLITLKDLPEITYEEALSIQNHVTKKDHWRHYNRLIGDDIQQLMDLVFINWHHNE